MTQPNSVQRSTLPIPDLAYTGTVTYDATDPDTQYPPITPVRRRRARRTCSSSSSTTRASARRAPSAARCRRRPSSGSRRTD